MGFKWPLVRIQSLRPKPFGNSSNGFFLCPFSAANGAKTLLCFPEFQNALAFCNPALPICHWHIVLTLRRWFESSHSDHVEAKFALLRLFLYKKVIRPLPCFSSFTKSHARLTCSVVNALTTVRCRYQLFVSFKT